MIFIYNKMSNRKISGHIYSKNMLYIVAEILKFKFMSHKLHISVWYLAG